MKQDFFKVNRVGSNPNKSGSKIRWTSKQKLYIIKHYNSYHNVKLLSKLFNVSQQTMRNLLHKNGVRTLSTDEKQKNIKKRNSMYFHVIDTPDKAYWLGFLYADGGISETNNRHNLRINLQARDKHHLEKFLQCIDGENITIFNSQKEMNDKIYYGVYISIGDKQMIHDLIDKGCVPRKSLILKFPTQEQVPNNLLSHFIRGYFDGDGTITYSTKKDNKLKFYNIGFLGTLDMLENILKFFKLEHLKIYNHGNFFSFTIGGNRQVKKILDILYKDSYDLIELDRKKDKYLQLKHQRETIPTRTNKDELII